MVYVPAISLGINLPVTEHLPRHPLKPCVLDARTYRTQYGPDVGHRGFDSEIRVTPEWVIPARELTWTFSRSSGPGGQGVNTTDSRVQVVFDVTHAASVPAHLRARVLHRLRTRLTAGELRVTASEHRSQWQNRNAAITRMVAILADASAAPPPIRRPTRPSRAAQSRRLEAKKRRSRLKRMRRAED